MSELLVFMILILLFVLRFAVPLGMILLFGRLLDRISSHWEAESKVTLKL